MSQPTGPEKIRTTCPHCGKTYATAAAHLGKPARCAACEETFVVAADKSPAQAPAGTVISTDSEPNPAGNPHCAFCQSPIEDGETTHTCPDCSGLFHEECWQYNDGCGVYGCSQAPPTEGLSSLEIPPCHWGQEEKPCPSCGKTILAAAIRCRHCGAVFSSATPQEAEAYSAQQRVKAKMPSVRIASIWLLIFSLVPCTAPLAAIIGLIWYINNRQIIRALPALNAALCKIAVGVAVAQTGLLILCGILAGMANG